MDHMDEEKFEIEDKEKIDISDPEAEEQPEDKKPRKKGRVWKTLAIIFGSLFLLILIAALVLFLIVNSKISKISREEITGNPNLSIEEIYETPTVDEPDSVEKLSQAELEFLEAQKIPIANSKGVKNILLIGSDRRSDTENGRSDTIILLSINYDTKKIHTTSFMRALYVQIPGRGGQMINAAYSWGGPNLLIDTIETNFRIQIDHYVVVDFEAFKKAVDLVGGIELDITEDEASAIRRSTKTDVSAGKIQATGAQALVYARVRRFDNDFKRTSRQRIVIEKVIQKAMQSDIGTLLKIADEILPMVYTDIQDNGTIWKYLLDTLPIMGNTTKGRMLPIENESGETYTGIMYKNGQEMYSFNYEKNIKALHDYINS